ncbi:hypothetical protein Peur_034444 [Populus x canadensis]
MFLVAIQRGMSSLFAFRCVPFCFRATFAVGGVTGGVDLDCCFGFRDRLSVSELSLFVFYFSPLLAAGSFHCYRLCRDYGKEQGIGIEALEAILMDDGFRGSSVLSFFPTEKIANKNCGCGCTGASIPFLFFLRFSWLMEIAGAGTSWKLKLLEDCTATPNQDCGCSRRLHQLFDSYCYGDGSNHLIFVTRIK